MFVGNAYESNLDRVPGLECESEEVCLWLQTTTASTFSDKTPTSAVLRKKHVLGKWNQSEETCKKKLESSKALLVSIRVH